LKLNSQPYANRQSFLREKMKQNEIIAKILASDELPTLPTVASKLISLTAKEETTLTDIAELVAKDMSLSAKILKVSNSAFYSFPQQIGSINQAVSILGINAVRSLVLSFSFLTMRGGKNPGRFNFAKFWEKSLAAAVSAKLILEKVKGADNEQIFVASLLQNLGELILARTFPEQYDQVLQVVEDKQYDIMAAEEEVFGLNHTVVGMEVARSWGFPELLQLPILYHHAPEKYSGLQPAKAMIRAVYLSDLLVNILFSEMPETYHKRFRKEADKLLGLAISDIEQIFELVHLKIREAGAYFDLKIKSSKSVQEILQEANIRLSLMNLDYDQMNKQLIQTKLHLEKLTKELEEKNKILDNLANLDGLTGIYNHRFFQNVLEKEIERAIRHSSVITLLLCDIDHFKKFNDIYGHQAGDFVLAEFAKKISSNIRKYDTFARYGGEEFAIILPETKGEDGYSVAEKLRNIIADDAFTDGRGEYHVTVSFGLASAEPATEVDFSKDTLIGRADKALYEAKEKGRNRVAAFSPKKKWFSF
jgi:two-component system cell cycle response regulator